MSISIIKIGGARAGAGRKKAGKVRRHVYVLPRTINDLTELGGGELSAGIDMAAARVGKLKLAGYARREDVAKLHLELEAWADSIAIWINEEQQP